MKYETLVLVTPMLTEKVGEVYNSNDVNAVVECFAPDAIFNHASVLENYGTRFEGLESLDYLSRDYFPDSGMIALSMG